MFRKTLLVLLAAVASVTAISFGATLVGQAATSEPTPLTRAEAISSKLAALNAKAATLESSAASLHAEASGLQPDVAALIAALQPKEETPPPPPPPPPSAETWGGYTASNPMPAGKTPYASTSVWNTPISSSPTVLSNSQAMVSWILARGNPPVGTVGTGGSYGHPLYFASNSDPVYELHVTQPWGSNPLNGMKVHAPAQLLPAPGSDGHVAIVEPDGVEIDLWQAKRPEAGKLVASWGSPTRIDGSGLKAWATAANFALPAGMIRWQEMEAGVIPHAIFCVVKNTHGTVFPASHGGSETSEANAPAMGQHIQLAMSDGEIAALSVPVWKKTILTAMAHYGCYVGDTGGPGFAFQMESSVMFTAFGLPDPGVTFAQKNGLGTTFDLNSGVPWASKLRAIG
jgi:hypothetical protein